MCTIDVRTLGTTNADYHLFREHELEELVEEAARHYGRTNASIHVVKEVGGWEKGNWWGVWRVVQKAR